MLAGACRIQTCPSLAWYKKLPSGSLMISPEFCGRETGVIVHDERIFDAMCAGASGYLLKKTPPAKLLDSLKEAVAGGAPMSPEVARRVITLFREIRPTDRSDYQLTPHELRLLKLFVEGHIYKTAAVEL